MYLYDYKVAGIGELAWYENVYKEYGTQVTGMFFSPTYRTTNTVDVNGYTPSTINMLGEYQQLYDIPYFSDNFKNALK